MGGYALKHAPSHTSLATSNAILEASMTHVRRIDSVMRNSPMSKPRQRGTVRFLLDSMPSVR